MPLAAEMARVRTTARVAARAHVERTVPFWPRELIERVQRRRLRAMVEHAWANVPYWSRTMRELGVRPAHLRSAADLARLPLVDAATVQERFDEFVSRAHAHEVDELWSSGSSTGVRRRILWSHDDALLNPAYLERVWPVVRRLARQTAPERFLSAALGESTASSVLTRLRGDDDPYRQLVVTTGGPANWATHPVWRGRLMLPADGGQRHALAPAAPFEEAVERVREVRPRIAFSLGSWAEEFLRRLDESGTDVVLPRVWLYYGESVSAQARASADRRDCALLSLYQCSEAGRIAFECERRDGLHVSSDLVAVRILGPGGRDLGAGETGEVVVTGLRNRTTVLLNYRLGDSAEWAAGGCGCGRTLPRLARLAGRTTDVVDLGRDRSMSAFVVEAMLGEALRGSRNVQFVQRAPGELLVRVVAPAGVDRDAVASAIAERADDVLEGVRLDVEFADAVRRTPAGKVPKLLREGS